MLNDCDIRDVKSMMERAKGKVAKVLIHKSGFAYHDEPNTELRALDANGKVLSTMLFRDCEVKDVKEDTEEYLMAEYGLTLEEVKW